MRLFVAFAALLIGVFALAQGVGQEASRPLAEQGYAMAMVSVAKATEFKQRHQTLGVDCAGCHGAEPDFSVVPTTDVCLACHESYEAVAALTADVVPNPHHSHMGEVTCTDCHSEHQEPRLSCNQCHVFEMEVP